jgi:hypothetical protein
MAERKHLLKSTLILGWALFCGITALGAETGKEIVRACDAEVEKKLPACREFNKKLRAQQFKTGEDLRPHAGGCDLDLRNKLFLACADQRNGK